MYIYMDIFIILSFYFSYLTKYFYAMDNEEWLIIISYIFNTVSSYRNNLNILTW